MHAAQATMHATQATAQRNNHHLLKRTHFPRHPCLLVLFCSTFGTFYFREPPPPLIPSSPSGTLKAQGNMAFSCRQHRLPDCLWGMAAH